MLEWPWRKLEAAQAAQAGAKAAELLPREANQAL